MPYLPLTGLPPAGNPSMAGGLTIPAQCVGGCDGQAGSGSAQPYTTSQDPTVPVACPVCSGGGSGCACHGGGSPPPPGAPPQPGGPPHPGGPSHGGGGPGPPLLI